MSTLEKLAALRSRANVQGRAVALDQFRADFKAVFDFWGASGELTADEHRAEYAMASAAVKDHMVDADWMACASAHFAQMAGAIRRDRETADRIRAEMAADREARERRAA